MEKLKVDVEAELDKYINHVQLEYYKEHKKHLDENVAGKAENNDDTISNPDSKND